MLSLVIPFHLQLQGLEDCFSHICSRFLTTDLLTCCYICSIPLPYVCIISSGGQVGPSRKMSMSQIMDEDIQPELSNFSINGIPQKTAHFKFSYSPLEFLFPHSALPLLLIVFNLQEPSFLLGAFKLVCFLKLQFISTEKHSSQQFSLRICKRPLHLHKRVLYLQSTLCLHKNANSTST